MKKTSLHESHLSLKAKMAPFAGFDMPLQYNSVKEEVISVREKVGVFDVSHMGEFFVEGEEAIKFVDHIMTNDFANAEEKKAVYSPLCNEDGKVLDDLIAYKISNKKILICVNASNIEKDWNWIESKLGEFNCTLTNKSDDYSLLAVQGPETEKVLKALKVLENETPEYYSVITKTFNDSEVILARTGYTGEDGFEIFCSHSTASLLWKGLLEQGVAPCGLASRDVLRLEVCYPLYGHELSEDWTPLDAGLKWTVKMNKEQFIGKQALGAIEKSEYRLIKLSLSKGIPREGYPILNEEEKEVGKVTSGTMSVTLGKGICLGLVRRSDFPENKKFMISIRNKVYEAEYHTKGFVTGGHK